MPQQLTVGTLLSSLLGQQNTLIIPRALLGAFAGDYPAAVLCAQLVYWRSRATDPDGWVYKTYGEWHDELLLSEYQVRTATKKMVEAGFLATTLRKVNGAPTLHYQIDLDAFSEWILKKLQIPTCNGSRIESEKTPESTYTETTPETTNRDIAPRVPRRRDVHWDTQVEIFGFTPTPKTPEHGRWNKAVAIWRALDATPDDMRAAADRYRQAYPSAAFTVLAVAGRAEQLLRGQSPPLPPPRIEDIRNALVRSALTVDLSDITAELEAKYGARARLSGEGGHVGNLPAPPHRLDAGD